MMKRLFPVVALLACSGKSPGVASAPAPAPPPPIWAPAPPEEPRLSLPERLAREANSRPAGAVRLEDVVAALEHSDVPVARTRQVLGSILGARYCATAVTRRGLGLAVCEYDSAEAARAGEAQSHERFDRLIPGRRLLLNGQTLLTIAGDAPVLVDESNTVAAVFAALTPR